jgi:hypothetical protein
MRRRAGIHPVAYKKVKMPTGRVLNLGTIYYEKEVL